MHCIYGHHNKFMILKESKNVSIENQVVCEIVASRSLKRGMLTKNCKKYGVTDLSVGKVTKQIKQDFDKLMNGEQIKKRNRHEQRLVTMQSMIVEEPFIL